MISAELAGGDCLNAGCVPSKALLRCAKLIREAKKVAMKDNEYGISFKLKKFGIGGHLLCRLKNYLQNRMQKVVIKNESSNFGFIQAGVPKGSVLGPLLFLVYINDLVKNIKSEIKLFADDTCLYIL